MTTNLSAPRHAVVGQALRGFDFEVATPGHDDVLPRLISRSRRNLVGGIGGMAARLGLASLDPEDIFQDTVICCFHGFDSLRADNERGFRAWFLGVARNQMLQRLRRLAGSRIDRAGGHEDESALPPAPSPRPNGAGPLCPPGARRLWNQPIDGRSVLMLHELFELSWSDVATVLSRPTGGAARGLHSRARR